MALPALDGSHDAFPIRTVAQETGLSPDVIRAWERRYAVVRPIRGPRGSRLYSRDDITLLCLLANAVASGRAIGDVATLDREALRALTVRGLPAATSHQSSAVAELLEAIGRFDAGAIDRLLGDALMALGAGAFARQVARPLLVEVGIRTSDGRFSIADEHLVSALMRNLLTGIMRSRGQGARCDVLLATPSGERHEFGLLLAALHVVEAGLRICYLGIDLPAAEIASAAKRAGVRIVGIGVVDSGNRTRSIAELRVLENALPEHRLWLGGSDAREVVRGLAPTRFQLLDREDLLEQAARNVAVRPGIGR